jgi:hypothetical protein
MLLTPDKKYKSKDHIYRIIIYTIYRLENISLHGWGRTGEQRGQYVQDQLTQWGGQLGEKFAKM